MSDLQTVGSQIKIDFDSHDRDYQIYLIHEYLRRSRLNTKNESGKTFSQEQLSEDIMNLGNYSRVETGRHRPRRDHFEKLTKRMGVSSELIQGEIITKNPGDFSLMSDIRRAVNGGDKDEVKLKLQMLSKNLDRKYAANAQFLDEQQVSLDILEGRLSRTESIPKLIDILSYTTPYRKDDLHVYSRLEGEILYRIVETKRVCGRMTDEDVVILMSYLKSVETASVTSWDRKQLPKRLLAGILQTAGELKEAEQMSEECLVEMIKAQDATVMPDCLDILAESILDKDPRTASELLKAAYWLCDFYGNDMNKQALAEFYIMVYKRTI